jgi:hypothetical protein
MPGDVPPQLCGKPLNGLKCLSRNQNEQFKIERDRAKIGLLEQMNYLPAPHFLPL